MKEALKLMSYVNRPPRTPVLQCDRIIIKGNQTIKITSQFTDRNQIKRTTKNIKDLSNGYERNRTCRTNSFSYGLRPLS